MDAAPGCAQRASRYRTHYVRARKGTLNRAGLRIIVGQTVMPAPQASLMKQLARLKFTSFNLKVPHELAAAEGDPAARPLRRRVQARREGDRARRAPRRRCSSRRR